MNRDRWIIVTSINPPTKAIHELVRLASDWNLLVVGDRKSPKAWECEGATFLSVDEQAELGFELSRHAPFNHYARKNLGYLYAMAHGARVLLETDDDNIPSHGYPGSVSDTVIARRVGKIGWDNVYTHFSSERIWARGFPLELINESFRERSGLAEPALHKCIIQQFLADGNPDVDAVYRLTSEVDVTFAGEDIVLGPGTWSPFNSQNTLWHPPAFSCLYLPFTATFRMTDIWRSFVAQACVHGANGNIAFRQATMYQERNQHSLIADFADEVSGYLNNMAIMDLLHSLSLGSCGDMSHDVRRCYAAMIEAGYLRNDEMRLLDFWLADTRSAIELGLEHNNRVESVESPSR